MSSSLNIKGMNDNNQDISANEDAGLYYTSLSGSDVVFDIKDNLECYTNGLKIIMKAGQGVIQGHHFSSYGGANLNVNANSKGYIAIEFDKTKGIGMEYSLVSSPIIIKEDLLNNGLKRQLALYQFMATDSSISLVDVRKYYIKNEVTYIKVEDAQKLNGKDASYYASANKLNVIHSGTTPEPSNEILSVMKDGDLYVQYQ